MVLGLFEEAAALVFLYATAEAVEELTFARTRSAIRELRPSRRTCSRAGARSSCRSSSYAPATASFVRPEAALPTDGITRLGKGTNAPTLGGVRIALPQGDANDRRTSGTLNLYLLP